MEGTGRHHMREKPLPITVTPEEFDKCVNEIKDGTIADVNLSLFTFWICKKRENYEKAREMIRELGLDRGYPTAREPNKCLRKLLEDVKEMRPRAPYCSIDASANDPTPFDQKSSARTTPAPPWSAHSEIASRAALNETPSPTHSCSLLSPDCEYPPPTPDRPAPLKFRCRETSSTPANYFLRSAPSPVQLQHYGVTSSLNADRRVVTATVLSGPPPSAPAFSPSICDNAARDSLCPKYGATEAGNGLLVDCTTEGGPQQPEHGNIAGTEEQFTLSADDTNESVGTSILYEYEDGSNTTGDAREHSQSYTNYEEYGYRSRSEAISRHEQLFNEENIASKTAMEAFSPEHQSPYQFVRANSQLRPLSSNPALVPTLAQRREAQRAQMSTFDPASNLHRPSAIRSYESETHLSQAVDAQSQSVRNCAKVSTSSPPRGSHPLQILGLDDMTRRVGPSNLRVGNRSRDTSMSSLTSDQTCVTTEEHRQTPVPASAPDSASGLAINLHADVFRSTAQAYFAYLLGITRTRGAASPSVNMHELPRYEVTWRESNGHLLGAIFGRKDVVLTDADVTYVNRIARDLRQGIGQASGWDWVGQIFHQG